MPSILLLSGPIASGKTTLAENLITAHGFRRLKSSDYLKTICTKNGVAVSRTSLQEAGDQLDLETDYQWLVTDVAKPQMVGEPAQSRWLIDAVRKDRQIEQFRTAFGTKVIHAHIWAPEEVLKARYEARLTSGAASEGTTSYAEAISHPNEIATRALKDAADVTLNVAILPSLAAASAIAAVTSF
jgi:hypothetical protein